MECRLARNRREHLRAHVVGRAPAYAFLRNDLVQRPKPLQLIRAMRAGRKMLLELQRMRRIEFAVDEAVKHQLPLGALRLNCGIHFAFSCKPVCWRQALSNCTRARASRDITVPIGIAMVSAIWR